jgi:hypothetical protein
MTAECSGQFYRSKLRGIEPALIQTNCENWFIAEVKSTIHKLEAMF